MQLVQHFAFQPFQVFQRYIQKVSRTASRIQHAHIAQTMLKFTQHIFGFFVSFSSLASISAAVCAVFCPSRSGSITVGNTKRSTHARGV
ncbi:MAG: hypothetical protein R3E61_09325 [Pseudomonadales bacterium]